VASRSVILIEEVPMSCGHECYHIGGPWIAEDPDCPVHGAEAVREREAAEAKERTDEEHRSDLQSRIDRAIEASNHGRAKDAIQDMLSILLGEDGA
jgi:hypothetical protein